MADPGGAGGGSCDDPLCQQIYQQLAQQAAQEAAAVDSRTDLTAPAAYQLKQYYNVRSTKYAYLAAGDSMNALQQTYGENAFKQWMDINGMSGEYTQRQALDAVMIPAGGLGILGLTDSLNGLGRNWAAQDRVLPGSPNDDCSFSAVTLVATDEGERAIATLHIGDRVLAYNPTLGKNGYYTITAILAHTDPVIEYLTIDGEQIATTPEHPFYAVALGWVPAGELWIGIHVRKADGEYGTVEAIQQVRHLQPMYNLTVAEAHTFFVGNQRLLVHNACPWSVQPKVAKQMSMRGWTPSAIDDVLNNPADIASTTDFRHDPASGLRVDQGSATVYYRSDGQYVVQNDLTGEIIQVSDTTDLSWIDPFGDIVRPR